MLNLGKKKGGGSHDGISGLGGKIANLAFVAFDKQDLAGPKDEILTEDVKSDGPKVAELALLDEKINERADEYLVEQQRHQAMADTQVEIIEQEANNLDSMTKSVVKHKKEEISPDEMTDLLHDTFVDPKAKQPEGKESIEVPSEDDVINNKETEKKSDDSSQEAKEEPPADAENNMTVAEQMEQAKQQIKAQEKQEEQNKKKAELKKKADEALAKKKQEALDKVKKEKEAAHQKKRLYYESQGLDADMMEQLEKEEEVDLKAQNNSTTAKAPKSKKEQEIEEVMTSDEKDKKKIDFENTDTEDALDQVGASLARHSFERNLKRGSKTKKKMESLIEVQKAKKQEEDQALAEKKEEERKQKEKEEAERKEKEKKELEEKKAREKQEEEEKKQQEKEEAAEKKKEEEEKKAKAEKDKIEQAEIEKELSTYTVKANNLEKEKSNPPAPVAAPTPKTKETKEQIVQRLSAQFLQKKLKKVNTQSLAESTIQQTTAPKPGAVNMAELIKNAVAQHSAEQVAEAAPPPVLNVQQADDNVSLPEPPKSKLNALAEKQVQKKLLLKQKESGLLPPSDITQALADSADEPDNNKEPTGFFGKYLKKHRDMKKNAENEVLEEQKQAKQRMIEIMKEKIAATPPPAPEPAFSGSGTDAPVVPKKKKRLGLFEKMQAKIAKEAEDKKQSAISTVAKWTGSSQALLQIDLMEQ